MKRGIEWLAMVVMSLLPVFAFAQTVDLKALVVELKQGGYVIVFRHGATRRIPIRSISTTSPSSAS
jgi:hypothetical protein